MSRRIRVPLPRPLLAALLVPAFALAACTPAHDEGFEEEPPAADVADADTGAGSAIETEAAAGDPPAESVAGVTPCDTEAVQGLIGQPGSEALYEKARQDAGARQHRAIGPGDAVTLDFREDRLNIDLDAEGRITGFRCG
ncbi:I78 family peptidase inhibitor [Luteimonas sp. FCS-9]|uniref:I78 family peptidase inhibitor n=1 Tax=Luteimonas sp. FCS-9 TaxID=1547516 RepID=UPI00063ED051|nr:I78 family peptidase inhibitor [Luteimonas sp. FCS-9]KLI99915.1 hypothetical protein WQ56_11035 [Luteimonas sp. FCS-9]